MKRFFILLLCVTTFVTGVMAQATSLTVDNQTPGWLSGKINYGDQLTVENLKVTGYLNGTDIKFMNELYKHSLHGTIDLSDANIVSGGDYYYSYSNNSIKYEYYTTDNTLSQYMFTSLSCQKLILPKSIVDFKYDSFDYIFVSCKIDSLIILGNPNTVHGFGYSTIGYISIPEGTENVDFGVLHNSFSFNIPSSIKSITSTSHFWNIVIYSKHVSPQDITSSYNIFLNSYHKLFESGTIYVPKGTAELYKNTTLFSSLTVIEQVAAESLSLNITQQTLNVGESLQLEATVSPYDADNQAVDWISSDESVAEVDTSGKVVAKKAGVATITATSNDNPAIKAECEITVLQPATGISLDKTSLKFTSVGETAQLIATVAPNDASNKTVNWTTSDNAVCTVSQDGTVIATGRGTAVITATAADGGLMASCNVTVSAVHKLTYYVDGEEYYSEMLESGTAIVPKEEPTKEGYVFSGWYTIPSTMPDKDVVVSGIFYTDRIVEVHDTIYIDRIVEVHDTIYVYEDFCTDIQLEDNEAATLRISKGIVYIENAPIGVSINVYNTDGVEVKRITVDDIVTEICLPRHSVYIIRIGAKTFKISI